VGRRRPSERAVGETSRLGEIGIPTVSGSEKNQIRPAVNASTSLTAFIGEQHDDLVERRAARAARAALAGLAPMNHSIAAAVGTAPAREWRPSFDVEEDPIGKALIGLDGRYIRVNPALSRITGYSQARLLELLAFGVTHPDDVADDQQAMERALTGWLGNYSLETRYLTAAGGVVWVLKSALLIRDVEGTALHFVSEMRNIDDRKKQETSLTDECRRRDSSAAGELRL
jgi:PAS domain S-box-containing protein